MKLDRSGKMVNVGGGAPAYLGRGKGRKLGKKRGAMGGGRR